MTDDVLGVDAQVREWIVEMSTAEQGVRRQAAAAGPVRRHQVRPRRADVRELIVKTFSAILDPDTSVTTCVHRTVRTVEWHRPDFEPGGARDII